MALEIDGAVAAGREEAQRRLWEVSHWLRFFRRDEAITALEVTELLETGQADDDPLVTVLQEELR